VTSDADALLDQLTLEEKASLTSGASFWRTTAVDRLGIPSLMVSDGPHGLRAQPNVGEHVGLGGSLPATCFPTASAIASSWDPDLLRRVGAALGQEARACHVSVVLGPGVNIKRSPLCGRNFEYFSEDPYLAGELAAGIVDGIQAQGVGTSLKHFAANNQEHDRLRVDALVDERTLREIYLPAFERVVTACRPWTVMAAYNKVNGRSATENPWLLTQVLRDEWDFQGVVVSDWGAVYHRVPALAAGTDLEMPPKAASPAEIVAAVRAGDLDEAVLDRRVRALLGLVARGQAVLDLDETFDEQAHHALAREAAAQSVVLLQNTGGLLPLATDQRIAVVGELARTPRFQGAGSSQVNPTRVDVPLEAIRSAFSHVTFDAGYGLDDDSDDAALRTQAVRGAQDADVVVAFLGLPAADESEGFDRTHMNLPAGQLAMLAEVAAANPRVVVVLVNGSTVLLGDVVSHTQALLESWLGGQAAGTAIADVLTGTVNPSGRLAETIPHRLQDNSSYLNFPGDSQVVRYGERMFVGYRGYDASELDVAFPFGFGLSYTTFDMSDLHVAVSGSVEDGDLAVRVTVTVTNTGDRSGSEVVQVYVRDVEATVARPVRELNGFAKVTLEPGLSGEVVVDLGKRAFSFWSEVHRRWVVEAGDFVIEVGRHSRDLPLTRTLHLEAPSIAAPITADSTLREWVDDPVARQLIAEAVEAGAPDPLRDEKLVSVVGTMPMSTLATFPGMSLDPEALADAVRKWQQRSAGSELAQPRPR
jgi:beta-glucosidase